MVLRGLLRSSWKWLVGPATAIVIGPPAPAALIARRVTTHPETHLALVGYLSPASGARTPATSPASARPTTSPGSPAPTRSSG